MGIKCSMGDCGISCDSDACECSAPMSNPADCQCNCLQTLPAFNLKKVKKFSFLRYKRRIRVSPQSRYNICFRNVPITTLAQSFDQVLPNRILVPANKLTKKVNLSLKNKTFGQIIIASGLALKSK